jgi:nitrite reductase (NADH) large subunit
MNCDKNTECTDYIVCTCMGIMYSEIVQAIKDGHTTVQALEDMFMVGSGCTSCIPEIEQILEK